MAATKPILGHQTRLAIGVEGTWGTAVTPDRSLRPVKSALERTVKKDPRERLMHSSGSRNSAAHIRSSDMAGGTVTTELRFEGDGVLLKYAFGQVADSGAGSPYTHVYSQALAVPSGGLTMEQIALEAQTPGYITESFEGCLIDKWSITLQLGKVAMLDFTVIAETSQGIGASPTSTVTAPFSTNDVPMLFNQVGTLTYNSIALNVTSAKIEGNNALIMRQYVGSLTTAKPAGGRASMKVTITCEWDASTFDGALTADTTAALSIALTGTGVNTATFAATRAYVESCSRPITSAGIVMQTAVLVCESDVPSGGSNEGLTLTILNTQSSGVAV